MTLHLVRAAPQAGAESDGRRAAEEAREGDRVRETQRQAEGAEGRNWKGQKERERRDRPDNEAKPVRTSCCAHQQQQQQQPQPKPLPQPQPQRRKISSTESSCATLQIAVSTDVESSQAQLTDVTSSSTTLETIGGVVEETTSNGFEKRCHQG